MILNYTGKIGLLFKIALLGVFFMNLSMSYAEDKQLITHADAFEDLHATIVKLKNHVLEEGDKIDASTDEQLKLIDGLSEFDFGRFLLVNRGINGFWTRHMVLWPKLKTNMDINSIHPLEKWLLDKTPVVLATQQRFIIFQKILQQSLKENIVLASIPCGMMDDLLTLDYSGVKNAKLIGIDLDPQSINGAMENARSLGLHEKTSFIKENAWELNNINEFDIITSNGLNIYEPDNDKVILLYKKFYRSLKPDGILISSFLTPPPVLSAASPWNVKNLNAEDLRLQKVIFSYILSAKWQAFRTEAETIEQLKKAGFKEIQIFYDDNKLFPTFLARK